LALRQLDKNQTFQFFSYLFNLEEWAGDDQLRQDTSVDRQIVKNPVGFHDDQLRVGKRHVQMFSLITTPESSRPCLFSGLLGLDCDTVVCSTWRPKSATAARKEVDNQEKFASFFKVGVTNRLMSGRDFASLDKTAGGRAADKGVDDLSDVIRALDKKAHGEYSLRVLLAAKDADQLWQAIPAAHRAFVDARAQAMEESVGNLSAFYAMFPGNAKFNVFPMWLSEDHHARLSFIYAPHLGHPHSEDLDAEYLNVFETRTGTPFFQDSYVNGLRVQLIIGPTGTGKTTALEAIREGAEKNGYTVEGLVPTSRAAAQLREAGVNTTTLQSFLVRSGRSQTAGDPNDRHLYMLDESSLASTQQMKAFLDKIQPQDRVLVIGDTQQHQGVDAGKPFQQMQDGGMRTAQLTRSCGRKIPSCSKPSNISLKTKPPQGSKCLPSRGALRSCPTLRSALPPSPKTMQPNPRTPSLCPPTTAAVSRSTSQFGPNCKPKGPSPPGARSFRP